MSSGIIAAVVGVVVLLGGLVVTVLGVAAVWFFFFRTKAPSGPSRDDMLAELGYTPGPGANTWSRSFQGTTLVFKDAGGLQWSVRLPRYNTLTLHVEERVGGGTPEGRPFETEKPLLDRRFLFAAGQPGPQTLALVCMAGVTKALTEMKYVSLSLSGDELVVKDPERANAGGAQGGAEGERQAHLAVIALATSLFDTMYSKLTGTIMPDFR